MRAHEKRLELAGHMAADVPHNLVGDPLRLRQVMVNLLSNAIKFTDHGEIVLSVERAEHVAADQADPDQIGLRFSIRDTGIGIPEDKLSLIFSSFGQADSSTTRRYGGSGSVWRSRAGWSSCCLAARSRSRASWGWAAGSVSLLTFGAGSAVPRRDSAAVVNLRDVEILIVDDTEVNRLILRELLQPKGAESPKRQVVRMRWRNSRKRAPRGAGSSYSCWIAECRRWTGSNWPSTSASSMRRAARRHRS